MSIEKMQNYTIQPYIPPAAEGASENCAKSGQTLPTTLPSPSEAGHSYKYGVDCYRPELPKPLGSGSWSPSRFDTKLSDASCTLEIDIFAIMELVHELAQTQKKSARETRHLEYQRKWQNLENEAKELKESAGKEFAASLIQGVIQVAGGATSLHINIKTTVKTQKLIKDIKPDTAKFDPDYQYKQAKFQADIQVMQNKSNMGQTFNELGQGVGSIVAAPLMYGSKLDQEEQKQCQAEAEKNSASIDELKDLLDTLKEILDTVRAKLAAIEQSKHESRLKVFS